MCIYWSVPTEIIVKLLRLSWFVFLLLPCPPSCQFGHSLGLGLSLVKHRRTGKERQNTAGKDFEMWMEGAIQSVENRGRICRVGRLSITCLRHSGIGHLAWSAALVAGSGGAEVRWECCDVFAHAQFLPHGHACTKTISCTSPFPMFFPSSHRISSSSTQQSCEELEQVGGRSEENDGYEWEHFESWSKRSLEKGIWSYNVMSVAPSFCC